MSVGREFGHTIESCRALQGAIDAAELPIPMKMMVDIDHGDVTSTNPADIDPYAWAKRFPDAIADHPHQAVVDEQGRPLAVHRRLQQGWPHHAGRSCSTPCGRRRHRQRNLPGTVLPRARTDRPSGCRDDPRIGGFLGALHRKVAATVSSLAPDRRPSARQPAALAGSRQQVGSKEKTNDAHIGSAQAGR